MIDELTVDVTEGRGLTVVSVAGVVDYANADVLRKPIEIATCAPPHRLVLDLRRLAFVDSTGLSLFILADRWARDNGGWVRLAEPPERLRRLLRTTNSDRRLSLYGTVPEALAGSDPE